MDFDILSYSNCSENLKCADCKNYLSYLPIYITATGQNICGRCPRTSDKEKCTRNLAFEALSQFVKFPCRFKSEGCNEIMLPKELSQHELVCPYKIITCPSSGFTGCQWKGALPTVVQHCLDKHFELFLETNGEFTVDVTQSQQTERFLRYKEALYIFSRKFDATTNMLQCAIYHIDGEVNMENYSCALTLRKGKRVVSDECYTTAHHEKEYINIVLDCLKSVKVPVVLGQITIEKCIEDEAVLQERINEELLHQLQCTNCSAYVLPPIRYCFEDKINCYMCSTGCEEFRNYNLDNIANLLNYPCKYKVNGCSVILKPEQMKYHQAVCQYGNQDCLFSQFGDCLWGGMGKDMFVHMEENHSESFIENSKEISVNYGNSDVTQQYFVRYSHNFFRVLFSTSYNWEWDQQIFNWNVQKVGHLKDTFMYDIEVTDKNDRRRKVMVRQLCLPFTDKDEVFLDKKEYCHFTYSQLEALLTDGCEISFKINIFQ